MILFMARMHFCQWKTNCVNVYTVSVKNATYSPKRVCVTRKESCHQIDSIMPLCHAVKQLLYKYQDIGQSCRKPAYLMSSQPATAYIGPIIIAKLNEIKYVTVMLSFPRCWVSQTGSGDVHKACRDMSINKLSHRGQVLFVSTERCLSHSSLPG